MPKMVFYKQQSTQTAGVIVAGKLVSALNAARTEKTSRLDNNTSIV
jgi:hypothetical protein